VILVEGEKTTLTAAKHFPDYDCVSWSDGSKAVNKTTFVALKNKKVILFPDNDKPGFISMHEIAKILIEGEITFDVHIVELHKDLPEAWDVADPVNVSGVTYEGILNTQKEYDPEEHIKIWEKIVNESDINLC